MPGPTCEMPNRPRTRLLGFHLVTGFGPRYSLAMALKLRKNTAPAPAGICPLTKSLALLRGAWAPEIIWFLRGGPRRFGELRVDMPSISAKVLTTRLRDLERKGIVIRRELPTSPPSVEYMLSEVGLEFVPVIKAIAELGDRMKFGTD